MPVTDQPFRVAFVAGVAPDKWVRRWRQRTPDEPLQVELVDDADQLAVLREGRADMAFVRLPVDRTGLHVIPLYVEVPVAVVSVEHELSLLEELSVADLVGEQLVNDPESLPGWSEAATVTRLDWPAMSAKEAIEVVASGTGFAVVPMSVARLHHRKDVTSRPLTDGPELPVGLAWRADDEDPRLERFVGIVRGRTEQSSRADGEPTPKKSAAEKSAAKRAAAKKAAAQQPAKKAAARQSPRKPTTRATGKPRAGAKGAGTKRRGR